MSLKILLADDHETFRRQLRELLERQGLDVIAETSTGREALRVARELRPDVAVLDFLMPVMSGLEAGKRMAQVAPETRIILLTSHPEVSYVVEALRAGIAGYVLKNRAADELTQAIHEVSVGATYLSSGLCRKLVEAMLSKPKPCRKE